MGQASSILQQRPAVSSTAEEQEDFISTNMVMANRAARRFAGRGEELDDLIQVAMLELVKAASRFDSARGVTFAQYAYPCILGGLKKHFRDNGWSLHVTRRVQELHMRISRAIPALTQLLRRHPTVTDLALHLNLSKQEVQEGVRARLAYQTRSLSSPTGDGQEVELGQTLGGVDEALEAIPDRHMHDGHVAALPTREQEILRLRFSGGLTQREIAEQLGISQMHVSRLLARSLGQLRTAILAQN